MAKRTANFDRGVSRDVERWKHSTSTTTNAGARSIRKNGSEARSVRSARCTTSQEVEDGKFCSLAVSRRERGAMKPDGRLHEACKGRL